MRRATCLAGLVRSRRLMRRCRSALTCFCSARSFSNAARRVSKFGNVLVMALSLLLMFGADSSAGAEYGPLAGV